MAAGNTVLTEVGEANPLLEIHDERDFLGGEPETASIRYAIKSFLAESGGSTIRYNADKIVERACSIRRDVQPERVRHQLLRHLENDAAGPVQGIGLHGRRMPRLSGLSPYVSLSPDIKKMTTDMVNGVEALVRGEGVRDYTLKARALLDSPTAVKTLLEKWRRFSPRVQAAERQYGYTE